MNIYFFQRIMGIGILLLQIALVVMIGYLVYSRLSKKKNTQIENFINSQSLWIVSMSSLLAIIGSLLFSEVYGIKPCKLCWLQRIFIYPQFIIAGIAAWKKDNSAWLSLLWLSVIGFVIAVYQTLQKFGVKNLIEMDCTTGPDAACSKIHMLEFGYITFPLASATLFLLIILLYFFSKRK